MADYPLIPLLLSTMDETTPTQLEDAAKIGDALRQTRTILKGLLSVIMNDNGTLKNTSALSADSVTTTTIVNLAVTTAKIADLAITTGKLADGAVTAIKLANLAVETAKINDLAVTAAKLALLAVATGNLIDKAVSSAKLANDAAVDANRAVGSDHVKDSAIITRTIADLNITPAKISNIGAHKLLVGNGTGAIAATVGGALTAALVGTTLEFTLAGAGGELNLATAVVSERAAAAGAGGSATGGIFEARPVADSTGVLVEEDDPLAILTITSGKINITKAGEYLILLMASAYSCGTHVARLRNFTKSTTILECGAAAAPAGVMNMCFGQGVVTVPDDGDQLVIEHQTEFAKATNGFGLPHGIVGQDNRYLYIQITKVAEGTQ